MGSGVSRYWACACLAMTACTTNASGEPPERERAQPAEVPKRPVYREYERVSPDPGTTQRDPVPQPLLDKILADAASRAGVDRASLEIASTQKVTWNDGSLGCAQPDGMYTQALVPGYRVWVRAPSGMLDYHAAEAGHFVHCTAMRAVPGEPVAE